MTEENEIKELERKLAEKIKELEEYEKTKTEKEAKIDVSNLLPKFRELFGRKAEEYLAFLDESLEKISVDLETGSMSDIARTIEDLFFLFDGKFMPKIVEAVSLEANKLSEGAMNRYYRVMAKKLAELKEYYPEEAEESMKALVEALGVGGEAKSIKNRIVRRLFE